MKNRGIAFKLILFTLFGTVAVFLSTFTYFYYSSKNSMIRLAGENARNLAHSTAQTIEKVLRGVEKIPLNYSSMLSSRSYGSEEITTLNQSMVSANPEVYGVAVGFEPGAFKADTRYFLPYSYRKDGRLTNVMLGDESYHYFDMDWYQIPKELDSPAWTEPYYDEGGGNIMMTTFGVPFHKEREGKKYVQGVVCVDMALKGLQDVVRAITLYRSGFAFMISRNGVFITHPDENLVMTTSIFSIAEEKQSNLLRQIGKTMIGGGEGLVALESGLITQYGCWLYFTPLPSIGWSLGIVIPEDELFEDIYHLSRMVVLIGAGGIILMAVIVMVIARRITRPLKDLSATTAEIARGNLDVKLPGIRAGDEIGTLAGSFEEMQTALKDHIRHLTETTAAKERIESELKIARNIQMSFLPKAFPPLTGQHLFDVCARLEPAREIGGDLYDYFMIDGDHLFFAVGDVSDKGIPAALFMAVTKTLLKGSAETDMNPAYVLSKCNRELVAENDSMMFVTVFCGVLNLRTGLLTYSNAGHEHPVLVREGGQSEFLPVPDGFLLGIDEDSRYKTMDIKLKPGDTLVVYTDGVTEAANIEGQLYAHERLMETIHSCSTLSAEQIATGILESVKRFSSGTPQADDITVLALSFLGEKD